MVSDSYIRTELDRLARAKSTPTSSRFAPTGEEPVSRFSTLKKRAGTALDWALNGKKFAAWALPGVDEEDIEALPGPLKFAVENLASPVGLASLALSPVTGGASIAAKLGLGASLASKPLLVRGGVNLAGMIASDLAVSAAAAGAGKGVNALLPEDTDPRIRTAVSLATGLLAGAGTARGISKTFNPTVATASTPAAIKAFQEDFSLPNAPNLSELSAGLAGNNKQLGARNILGTGSFFQGLGNAIDPSHYVRTTLGKLGVSRTQAEIGNKDLANTWLAAKFPRLNQVFQPNNKGEILVQGQRAPWRSVFDRYDDLSDAQKAVANEYTIGLDEAIVKHNMYVKPEQALSLDDLWVPKYDSKGLVVYSNNPKFRTIEDNARAYKWTKADIERPDTYLYLYAKSALDAEINSQYDDALKPFFLAADDALANTEEGKKLKSALDEAVAATKQTRESIERFGRRELGASISGGPSFGSSRVGRGSSAQIDIEDETLVQLRQKALEAQYALDEAQGSVADAREALNRARGGAVALPGQVGGAKFVEQRARTNAKEVAKLKIAADKAAREYETYRKSQTFTSARPNRSDFLPGKTSGTTRSQQASSARVGREALEQQLKTVKEREANALKAWTEYKKNARPDNVKEFHGKLILDSEGGVEELSQWTQRLARGGEAIPGLNAGQQLADASRFFSASLDASGPFINLLPVMFSDPGAWGKAFVGNWKALFNPETQVKYLSDPDNYRVVTQMIRNNLAPADIEQYVSAARGGLAHNILQSKVGSAGIGKYNIRGAFEHAQSGYETGLLIARVEMWKAMENLPEFAGQPRRIADFIRESTGAVDTARMGVAPNQRTLESLALFSPRLFRSTAALMADALRPHTPEGSRAAHTLLRMLGASTGMFIVANALLGEMQGESEDQIIKKLEEVANPANGRQFLSIQVGDDWYGIGGTVRAVTQAIARAVSNEDEYANNDDNPFWNFFAGRLGPAGRFVSQGTEVLFGVDAAPYQEVDNIMDWGTATARGILPFYVQNALDDKGLAGLMSPNIAVDMAGLSSKPRTATDVRNSASYTRFGMEWKDLTDRQQDEIRAEYPELQKELVNSERSQMRLAIDDVNNDARNDLIAVNALNTTANDKRERIQEVLRDRWVQSKRIYETFAEAGNLGGADSMKRRVLDAYFKTFDDASLSGGTQTNWDKWEEYQADFKQRITNGEFGDPVQAQRYIDERSKFELPEELAWYTAAKEKVASARYWEQKDEAFSELANVIQGAFPEIDSARALDVAMANTDDLNVAARLKVFSNLVNKNATARRKLLKAKDQELAQALKLLGY